MTTTIRLSDMADPLAVLWIMRERPDFREFYRFIGSYYCREFHAWMHDERLMMDRTGKMAAKAKEWMAMKGAA